MQVDSTNTKSVLQQKKHITLLHAKKSFAPQLIRADFSPEHYCFFVKKTRKKQQKNPAPKIRQDFLFAMLSMKQTI